MPVTLTFQPMTFKAYLIRDPTVGNVCESFGSNPFSHYGSDA